MKKNIAVIVGSLRKASLNLKMAKQLIACAPESVDASIIHIGNLPLFNQDLEDEKKEPAAWLDFRKQIGICNGILFVTPEYNRSIPGALKNAIDVGSRPYGQSVWSGKPAAILSLSPGAIGGFGANHHLRQALVFLNMPTMQQPEAYIGQAGTLFDKEDNIADESTYKFLHQFMDTFAKWMTNNLSSS